MDGTGVFLDYLCLCVLVVFQTALGTLISPTVSHHLEFSLDSPEFIMRPTAPTAIRIKSLESGRFLRLQVQEPYVFCTGLRYYVGTNITLQTVNGTEFGEYIMGVYGRDLHGAGEPNAFYALGVFNDTVIVKKYNENEKSNFLVKFVWKNMFSSSMIRIPSGKQLRCGITGSVSAGNDIQQPADLPYEPFVDDSFMYKLMRT